MNGVLEFLHVKDAQDEWDQATEGAIHFLLLCFDQEAMEYAIIRQKEPVDAAPVRIRNHA